MNWPMAWRSAVGTTTKFGHELIHGEAEKGGPFWGRGPRMTVRPIHGGLGGHFILGPESVDFSTLEL